MGKMPAQMVTSGTAMNTGVVTAPTRYDHTPVQYMTRSHHGSSRWNSGQCRLERIIWKCLRAPRAARLVAHTWLPGGARRAGRLACLATGTQHCFRHSVQQAGALAGCEDVAFASLLCSHPYGSFPTKRGRALRQGQRAALAQGSAGLKAAAG